MSEMIMVTKACKHTYMKYTPSIFVNTDVGMCYDCNGYFLHFHYKDGSSELRYVRELREGEYFAHFSY